MSSSFEAIIFPLAALLMTALGVNLLYRSWRQREGHWRSWTGWGCLLLSMLIWLAWAGPEFGLVAGLCVPGVLALSQVFWVSRSRQVGGRAKGQANGRARNGDSLTRSVPQEGSWLACTGWHLCRFVMVVPYAALAAFFTTLALTMLLPWSELSRVALLVIAAPVVWGLMAAWLSSAQRLWRPALILLVFSLISLPLGLRVL